MLRSSIKDLLVLNPSNLQEPFRHLQPAYLSLDDEADVHVAESFVSQVQLNSAESFACLQATIEI